MNMAHSNGTKNPSTEGEQQSFEANRNTPCPLCSHDHFCYLVTDGKGTITKAVCQWTEETPEGWDRTGTAKDGRGIYTKRGAPQSRKYFPGHIKLNPKQCGGEKHWDAPFYREPIPQWKDTGANEPNGPKEQLIHYYYPAVDGSPLGRIERIQWTDRRKVYEKNRKSKQIRPQHWVGTPEKGEWSSKGKGERPWPLYREQEAKEEILKGGIVFMVGGEQAVEAYRSIGLVATTCQGGESNYRQVIERLSDAFDTGKSNGGRPLLAIHPDYDLTGETQFAEGALRVCYSAKISAIAMEPLELWPECPQGGDIFDFLAQSTLKPEAIIKTLETCISEAVDRQELEIRGRKQRARWQSPESWQGELGVWKPISKHDDTLIFSPLCDFDFQVERELISDEGGGLMLQVKRTDDRAQRRVYIKSQDYSSTQKFIDAIKKGLGGGVICNLRNDQLQALVRVRLHEYRSTRQGKSYRLASRIGQQGDGTWVFKQCQFTNNGEPTEESRSLWVWNSSICDESGGFRPPTIAQQNPEAIKNLVNCLQRAMGSNFMLTMLVMGYGAAAVHYQDIQEAEGAFPTMNLYGDPGSGKTTAAEAALSTVGQHKEGVMRSITVSAAYERLKLAGGLVHCLDDPERTPELDEFLKGFYNGNSRIVRGRDSSGFNIQKPHSALMVTSNHACGENSAATQSRLIRLFFPLVRDGDREAFRELPHLYNEASGCITQLMKIGYPKEEVYALEHHLGGHLPHAHQRIAKSIALVLHYAMEVAKLAGMDPEPIKTYVENFVCTQVNDPDEAGDSLRDFLEKLFVLQSESKVGEWNCRWVDRESGRSLAVYLPGVWAQMDKGFSIAYNRKIIESLLMSRGIRKTRQYFHGNEDESRAFQRAKLALSSQIEPNPPERVQRWCYEIPHTLLIDASEKNSGADFRSPRSPDPEKVPQSHIGEEFCVVTNTITNDHQRSPNFIGEDNLSNFGDRGDQIRQVNNLLDHHPQTQSEQELDPSSDSLVIVVIKNNEAFEKNEKNAIFSESVTQNKKVSQGDQNQKIKKLGEIVVPIDTARWIKARDVTKLPWRDLRPSLKTQDEISVADMPPAVQQELLSPSRIQSISRDRTKALVLSQTTGRKSLFYCDDLISVK